MNKLSADFLDRCNADNCCMNEFIALPCDGDVGFEEYYEHKAKEIVRAKKIFSPLEQNMLMLAYPRHDSVEPNIFDRFFESPVIVARNHEFEGCFAIDVSAYLGREDDEHFDKLLSFISRNRSTVYLLFAYTDNVNEIDAMYENIARYGEIRRMCIGLPSAKELTEYTVEKIRDFSLHVRKPVSEYLEKYYSDRPVGYDFADYLVRCLKNSAYDGNLDAMMKTTADIASKGAAGGAVSDYGY